MAGKLQKKYMLKTGEIIVIRPVKAADSVSTMSIAEEILKEGLGITSIEEFHHSMKSEREWIKSYISNQQSKLFLVAVHEKKVIGFLNFDGGEKLKTKHQGSFGISITSAWRNKGVGKQLIADLLQWCRENPEIEKVRLEVLGANTPAIALYKKLGFREEGRLIDQIKSGTHYDDLILMATETKS
ncbi:GNAT family N-acetyltransferase [Metabacillus lacus]|uniref:GNAT family N-acetyltransferase n=1 Tax=Metabacillus lacus TaxID=1983721 RepID=UPI001478E2BE|nr:GNAT family N-acetyltransferase [Metabacillus lacus]